jgi:hypothetical protein
VVAVADLIALGQLLVDLVDQAVAELMAVLAAPEQWDKDLPAERQPLQTQVVAAVVLVEWALLAQVVQEDQESIL